MIQFRATWDLLICSIYANEINERKCRVELCMTKKVNSVL